MLTEIYRFKSSLDQELHSFHRELMQYLPNLTTASKPEIFLVNYQLQPLPQSDKKLLSNPVERSLINGLFFPHYQRIVHDLGAIPSEVLLLSAFSAKKLPTLQAQQLTELGIDIEPQVYPYEEFVTSVVTSISEEAQPSKKKRYRTGIKKWCLELKQFSDEYLDQMALPADSYNIAVAKMFLRNFSKRIQPLRKPILDLVGDDSLIKFS